MRFYNYTNTFEKIKEILTKECSEILSIYKRSKKVFYRGTKHEVKSIQEFIPKNDRKPKDTPIKLSNYLDEFFNKNFGWKARSEGIFATPNEMQAQEYTKLISLNTSLPPDIFFPVNGFKFIWSKEIKDLFADIDNEIFDVFELSAKELFDPRFDTRALRGLKLPGRFETIDKFLVNKYTNTNLTMALFSNSEVMFKCKKYYLVNPIFIKKILGEV